MKLPKTIIIGGQIWQVKTDKNREDAFFDGNKNLIVIGTKLSKDVPSLFIHEVLEAILSDRDCRYSIYVGIEEFLFNFSHKEFIQIAKDLTLALNGVLKGAP